MKINPNQLGNYGYSGGYTQTITKNKLFSLHDLSDEQQEFIRRAKNGENILVDACIGSGKTTAIQVLCNELKNKSILYLTYNKLLKIDAQAKIVSNRVTVTNYHGFAYMALSRFNIKSGISDLIQTFNKSKPRILKKYDIIIIDEYQDIEQEIADMLVYIKSQLSDVQIIAVGDMEQKIYDKTTLNVSKFIDVFLDNYSLLHFTKCFRLSFDIAKRLGDIWHKTIVGVNNNCKVVNMSIDNIVNYLAKQNTSDILCLGARTGNMSKVLNILEDTYPEKFNKKTVYASIADEDRTNTSPSAETAIFTTFDSSKGLERKICVVFDYTEDYWKLRLNQPMVNYEILRNIFCVAASRGKDEIIFADDSYHKQLKDETLATPKKVNETIKPYYISDMFSFKYKENIEECFNLINCKKIYTDDVAVIKIKHEDGLIDLSPCIGIYQEAKFFKNYNIDDEINFAKNKNRDRPPIKVKNSMTLDEKILYLTAYNTYHDRYVKQVKIPFINKSQSEMIIDRLSSIFTGTEIVQLDCKLHCADFEIKGRIDVLKNNIVHELKFVSELQHEHFLQCAMYMVLLKLHKGILWNVYNNEMFEITIPDRKLFMQSVIKTITKGILSTYELPDYYVNNIIESNAESNSTELSATTTSHTYEAVIDKIESMYHKYLGSSHKDVVDTLNEILNEFRI